MPEPSRDELVQLIAAHGGNISAAARASGIKRRRLAWLVEREGLVTRAGRARKRSGVKGPRPREDDAALTDRMLDALARADRYEDAIGALGLARATFYRHMERLAITPAKIKARRRLLARSAAA